MYRELLLGCGHARDKRIFPDSSRPRAWENLTTIDNNAACKPDFVADLNDPNWPDWVHMGDGCVNPDFLETGLFDEIHAYEVLEHLGTQGDHEHFLRTFATLWDLLKPGGYMCATTPSRYSPWLWGDPGHRRVVIRESLTFLSQAEYTRQIGQTALSDYRHLYKADFDLISSVDDRVTHAFILKAVKPSRIQE